MDVSGIKIIQYVQALRTHPSLLYFLLKNRSLPSLRNEFYEEEASTCLSKSNQYFSFNGKLYHYFYDRYSYTWATERTVEIPIIVDLIETHPNTSVLEIGNVLSHYQPIKHVVVDKYEQGDGVINEDAATFRSSTYFDFIFSISTIEHIGWDERPRDPSKIPRTIENLKSMLHKSGEFWITIPLGYNRYLTKLINEDKILFAKKFFMKRVSKNNTWRQCSWADVKSTRYGYPYNNANNLMIGVITK